MNARQRKAAVVTALAIITIVVLTQRSREDGRSWSDDCSDAPWLPQAQRTVARTRPGKTCADRHAPDGVFRWLDQTVSRQFGGVAPSWGDVLDAGTGVHSACWLVNQRHSAITAVTAAAKGTYGYDTLQHVGASVDVVLGNWRDPLLLKDREFDVVVADYLLGAVHQHWPFAADVVLDRLLRAVRAGGVLCVVGIEPYELVLNASADASDALVLDVEALGDAASALARRRSYRELPEAWVLRQIRLHGEFRVVASRRFPMALGAKYLDEQLEFAREEAKRIPDAGLRRAYLERAGKLQAHAASFRGARRARNYAVVVQRRRGQGRCKDGARAG